MKVKYLLASAFIGAIYGGSRAADTHKSRNNPQPRNIVFILSDDHRYDYMGFIKKIPWLETPNMGIGVGPR